MFTITVESGRAMAGLRQLGGAMDDMTPVMGRIADIVRDNTEDRFARQVAPNGSPWAPRSPVTVHRYVASGEGFGGILHRTGRMRQTLGTAFGRTFAEVSSAAIQSAVMQFGAAKGAFGRTARGGPIPWGNIPARPFLGFSRKDEDDTLALIYRYLTETTQP